MTKRELIEELESFFDDQDICLLDDEGETRQIDSIIATADGNVCISMAG
jgi:hypothetical protein